ncbi:hypothetical protein AB0G83_06690 [Streptomyces klenkii]|uniref:hypothetical protein n=1 Tax=Streptomyces klenkii TaxID=1420899 RepID=UPI003411AC90
MAKNRSEGQCSNKEDGLYKWARWIGPVRAAAKTLWDWRYWWFGWAREAWKFVRGLFSDSSDLQ